VTHGVEERGEGNREGAKGREREVPQKWRFQIRDKSNGRKSTYIINPKIDI